MKRFLRTTCLPILLVGVVVFSALLSSTAVVRADADPCAAERAAALAAKNDYVAAGTTLRNAFNYYKSKRSQWSDATEVLDDIAVEIYERKNMNVLSYLPKYAGKTDAQMETIRGQQQSAVDAAKTLVDAGMSFVNSGKADRSAKRGAWDTADEALETCLANAKGGTSTSSIDMSSSSSSFSSIGM